MASAPQRTSRTARNRLIAAIIVLTVQVAFSVAAFSFSNKDFAQFALGAVGVIGFYGWLIFLLLGRGAKKLIRRNGTVKGVGLANLTVLVSWLILLDAIGVIWSYLVLY